MLSLPGGRREQDMDEVWAAVRRVLGEVCGRSPDPVELVAVTAQGDGCWLVDGDGRPAGDALLWNDNRAAAITEGWHRDGTLDEAFAISGSMGAPGLASAQLRWLMDQEPDRVRAAAGLLSCGSWVFAQLTGRRVLERSDAANPLCAAATGDYDPRLLDLFGIASLERLLVPVVSGADAVATLVADVGDEASLPPGTPVVLAPYDVVSSAAGAGSVDLDTGFAVLGTTLGVGVVSDGPRLDRQPSGMTLPMSAPQRWLLAYATLTGTEALDWTARLLGQPDAASVARLAQTGERDDVPLFAPYLSPAGERSPFLDPGIRGQLRGLDFGHTPADVARAVIEGLTLAVVDCLETAGRPAHLALSGGGARSDYWCQLLADAAGLPVTRPDVSEMGALGAALCGAVATGRFDSLSSAVAEVVHVGPHLEPRAEETARLRARYDDLLRARDGS